MKDNMTIHREELERLSTQELDKILRLELDNENPKKETVLLLLSILEERDPTTSENRLEGTEEAFANRQRKAFAAEPVSENKKKWNFTKWIGLVAAVVAIAFVLLVTVPQTVGAESIFDIIGRWTKDLFSFSDGTDTISQEYEFKTDNEGLQQLYDAVVGQGVTDPVVPMWIPEGYVLDELKVVTKAANPKIYARFVKNDQYVQVMIERHSTDESNAYPKDAEDVKILDSNSVQYYLYCNEETWNAAWNNGNAECLVTITDSENVMHKIIKSIQRGYIYE